MQSLRTVHLERIDPARNVARFYTIAVEVTLFDDVACTRSFGRIGGKGGRVMVGLYATKAEAEAAFGRLLNDKLGRGYRKIAYALSAATPVMATVRRDTQRRVDRLDRSP